MVDCVWDDARFDTCTFDRSAMHNVIRKATESPPVFRNCTYSDGTSLSEDQLAWEIGVKTEVSESTSPDVERIGAGLRAATLLALELRSLLCDIKSELIKGDSVGVLGVAAHAERTVAQTHLSIIELDRVVFETL